ncbi:MAG: CCA tRNA nucleotidyltransferase [Polyangiaceae bacterium]|nr:CCA tRNA nucleotidyltransferase [Polyangiaceae bacterium]
MTETISLDAVPADVFAICRTLADKGKRAWIVGGCVRDLILGRTASDWDVCTDALPDDLLRIFPRAVPTGIAHGTVTVVKNHEHYEVTTLRGETTYSDGRRPDSVFFVDDITADLARRDFTVNAMAISPVDGHLIDPFDGQGDLRRGILRAVGDAHARFSEDGLRVLRAARFSAQLGFALDPATHRAIGDTLDTFRKVSAERIRDEWMKAMKSNKPSMAFEIMRETGLLAIICPELMESVGVDQNRYHTFDVWGHAMSCMDACVGDPVLRISALFHDVGKPRSRAFSDKTKDYTFYEHERIGAEMVRPICERLRFSTDERGRIEDLVRFHMWHYDGWTDAAVRRWIRRVGTHRVEDLYALREADIRGKGPTKVTPEDFDSLGALKAHVERILAEGAALTTKDLKVNGNDLMRELALKPGRILGEILEQLLEGVINDPTENDRDRLLARAREIVGGKKD